MTYAMPGSDQKVAVLAQRVRLRVLLWHPLDPVLSAAQRDPLERMALAVHAVANGRPVEPVVFEEAIARSTRAEIDLEINPEDTRPMREALGLPAPANGCPVCGWWHRRGGFCSWCGLDLERAAGMKRKTNGDEP
jgi:hypothetical protein